MSGPPSPELRQRSSKQLKSKSSNGKMNGVNGMTNGTHNLSPTAKFGPRAAYTAEWDYKVAVVVITVLAFLTRFYGISHPDQVVFDEVHFGKVSTRNHILK